MMNAILIVYNQFLGFIGAEQSRILNVFTGAMDDPSRVMTDRERTEHEALSRMFIRQVDQSINPERYSPLLQRLDNVCESAAGSGAYLAARAMGLNQQTQDRFDELGRAAGNIAFARSTAIGGGPAYTGARGAPDLVPNVGIPINGAGRAVPLGFSQGSQFLQAAQELQSALRSSGINDAIVGVRGSSVTGYSEAKGTRFGPQSDFDFFVQSGQLTNGYQTSRNIPGFVHPNKILPDYPLLRDWSTNWTNTLGSDVTPGAFVPGTLPIQPNHRGEMICSM